MGIAQSSAMRFKPEPSLFVPLVLVLLAQQTTNAADQSCPTARHDFIVVADPDKASRDPQKFVWRSKLLHGALSPLPNGNFTVEWRAAPPVVLQTSTARKNRSMELSEIVKHDNEWWTVCDVTGFVYTVDTETGKLEHRMTVMDGDGSSEVPAKLEWATERDGSLWLGSTGKPWQGTHDSEWVKERVPSEPKVRYHDWSDQFEKLRRASNITTPGYLWHEAVHFWEEKRQWVFAPRKESSGKVYDEVADELRGTNLVLLADETFEQIQTFRVGQLDREWGWSAIRSVPNDERSLFAALRVTEVDGRTQTALSVFDLEGRCSNIPYHCEDIVLAT